MISTFLHTLRGSESGQDTPGCDAVKGWDASWRRRRRRRAIGPAQRVFDDDDNNNSPSEPVTSSICTTTSDACCFALADTDACRTGRRQQQPSKRP